MDNQPEKVSQQYEATERALLAASHQIGSVEGSSAPFTFGLARRIAEGDKAVEDYTVGELIKVIDDYRQWFNELWRP